MPKSQQQLPLGEDVNSQIENCEPPFLVLTPAGHSNKAEVKREKHLEKNRKAAKRSRAKKKWEIAHKNVLHRGLESRNRLLKTTVSNLEKVRCRLQQVLMVHAGCGDPVLDTWIISQTTSSAQQNGSNNQGGAYPQAQAHQEVGGVVQQGELNLNYGQDPGGVVQQGGVNLSYGQVPGDVVQQAGLNLTYGHPDPFWYLGPLNNN
ncbi:uncharacterized protein B0H64DRAFT_392482 [Chaetomium fimeti]|uniref:BZIP domain-containing protein n=1 Tax=Chaetomium fimeti TaxID=1854472 RepID=A0AAE0LU98_9PEZI|nr:hypothetical protein B0H64DRAFT_392482 [Chaetomium fimeti]